MIVIVSGLPGAGKSVLVEKLAEHYGLKKIFASDILKQLQEKKPKDVSAENTEKSNGWWETAEGQQFNLQRLENKDFDKALDNKLLEIINKEDNVILDSRTMPWLAKKSGLIKVWVSASAITRAKRVAERDKADWKKVLQAMEQRLEVDRRIYKKLYKFDFSEDLMPFQIRLDTTAFNEKEVFEKVVRAIDKITGKETLPPEKVEEKKEEQEKEVEKTEEQKEETKETQAETSEGAQAQALEEEVSGEETVEETESKEKENEKESEEEAEALLDEVQEENEDEEK